MASIPGLRITEPGALFSLATIDPCIASLDQAKAEIQAATSLVTQSPAVTFILSELSVHHQHLLSLLNALLERKKAHETNEDRIETELEQCRERFAELPEVHAFINPMLAKTISQVRDNIYKERSELLSELRKMRTDYWKDVQEVKTEAAEVYGLIAGMARKLELLAQQPFRLPAFHALFAFLDAPRPSEVYIQERPVMIPSSMAPRRIP